MQSECGKYDGIFLGTLSVPHKFFMDMNNVMSVGPYSKLLFLCQHTQQQTMISLDSKLASLLKRIGASCGRSLCTNIFFCKNSHNFADIHMFQMLICHDNNKQWSLLNPYQRLIKDFFFPAYNGRSLYTDEIISPLFTHFEPSTFSKLIICNVSVYLVLSGHRGLPGQKQKQKRPLRL